jgi:hypothetical protein
MASYRYRCAIPSRELGLSINDTLAQVLVFAKPAEDELAIARRRQDEGAVIVVDFCDPHFDQPHYMDFALCADIITCPTQAMAEEIEFRVFGFKPIVIADPYEYPEVDPHCAGTKLLWYGHGSNIGSLLRVMRELDDYDLQIVSNVPWSMPWSPESMAAEFAKADIVVIPATAAHKSPNRAVEAIRQGCFVVAEPHPSLEGFPGIWIGNLKEGIEWAQQNLSEANERTRQAQDWVARRFSPQTLASAWKSLFERAKSPSTSEAEGFAGPAGSLSMPSATAPISVPTY